MASLTDGPEPLRIHEQAFDEGVPVLESLHAYNRRYVVGGHAVLGKQFQTLGAAMELAFMSRGGIYPRPDKRRVDAAVLWLPSSPSKGGFHKGDELSFRPLPVITRARSFGETSRPWFPDGLFGLRGQIQGFFLPAVGHGSTVGTHAVIFNVILVATFTSP